MADNHWINADGGNWSTVGNWSLGHAPTATEPALFDCAFNAGKTVTVDAVAYCLDMDWTGATNTPTLRLGNSQSLAVYGNVTFIGNMAADTGGYGFMYIAGTTILTTNGLVPTNIFVLAVGYGGPGDLTLADNIGFDIIRIQNGVFNTNNKVVTTGEFTCGNAGVNVTVTLGSSVINCSSCTMISGKVTLTANTSTINCSGNFAGGGITTYNIVNLTGSTPTISGNNTFNELHLHPTAAQTVKFTDGSNNTVTALTRENNLNRIILRGTAVAGWTITKAGGGTNTIHFVDVQQSTGAPANSFYVGSSGTLTGCTNWAYYLVTISPAGGSFIL